MKQKLNAWFPVIFCIALISILSSFSITVPQGQDKFWHIAEYGLLGFLTTRAALLTWDPSRRMAVVWGTLLATLFGAVDELHQRFVPGRQSSGWDLVADLLGASLGAVLFIALGAYLSKSQKLYPKSHSKCC